MCLHEAWPISPGTGKRRDVAYFGLHMKLMALPGQPVKDKAISCTTQFSDDSSAELLKIPLKLGVEIHQPRYTALILGGPSWPIKRDRHL